MENRPASPDWERQQAHAMQRIRDGGGLPGLARMEQLAIAEARIEDEQGKLYAHGTTTCFIFDPSAPG